MTDTPLLQVDEVTVTRENGKKLLDQVNLRVGHGEVTGVLGRNGAGKTTLAYTVMGLPSYRPNSGRIFFEGKDITNLSITERSRLGITLAWQYPARYEGITVAEYLRLSRKDATRRELEEALDFIQMEPFYLDRFVDKALSGGERKRLELASIYLMRPKLAILDEPDSGVDLLALGDVIKLFKKLIDFGSSVLVITHRDDIASACDRAYLLCNGKVMLEGQPIAVKQYFMSLCSPCSDPLLAGGVISSESQ